MHTLTLKAYSPTSSIKSAMFFTQESCNWTPGKAEHHDGGTYEMQLGTELHCPLASVEITKYQLANLLIKLPKACGDLALGVEKEAEEVAPKTFFRSFEGFKKDIEGMCMGYTKSWRKSDGEGELMYGMMLYNTELQMLVQYRDGHWRALPNVPAEKLEGKSVLARYEYEVLVDSKPEKKECPWVAYGSNPQDTITMTPTELQNVVNDFLVNAVAVRPVLKCAYMLEVAK